MRVCVCCVGVWRYFDGSRLDMQIEVAPLCGDPLQGAQFIVLAFGLLCWDPELNMCFLVCLMPMHHEPSYRDRACDNSISRASL